MKYSPWYVLIVAFLLAGPSSRSLPQQVGSTSRESAGDRTEALASSVWMPALATTHAVQDVIDDPISGTEALLMVVSGLVLPALQLRRRQKALRTARLAISTT
jgi:hypothetical protein